MFADDENIPESVDVSRDWGSTADAAHRSQMQMRSSLAAG